MGVCMLRIAVVTETYPPEINGVAMTISRMVEGLRLRHVVELIRPRQNMQDHAKHELTLQEVLVRGIPIPRYPGLKLGLRLNRQLVKLWTRKPSGRGPPGHRRSAGLIRTVRRAQARHPGQQRFPYQLPQLQQALRLRLAVQGGCRTPAQLAQPH